MITYYELVFTPIAKHRLTPEAICINLKVCPRKNEKIDINELANEILNDAGGPPQTTGKPKSSSKDWKNRELITVAHVSDIHVDLLYEEVSHVIQNSFTLQH